MQTSTVTLASTGTEVAGSSTGGRAAALGRKMFLFLQAELFPKHEGPSAWDDLVADAEEADDVPGRPSLVERALGVSLRSPLAESDAA